MKSASFLAQKPSRAEAGDSAADDENWFRVYLFVIRGLSPQSKPATACPC